jgi:hypothetical protein
MIRILATALLALSLTASGAFALSIDELILTDRLYYKKLTDVPFTGELDEGWARGAIKNGKRDGLWVGYWDNGRVVFKGAFKNGKEEGPWVEYYESGQLRFKGAWKNHKRHGPWVYYYENGTKNEALTGTYRKGKLVSH